MAGYASPRLYLHRPAGLGFAEGRAGFGEAAQEGGGGPAFAVLLVPRLDLAVNLGDADAVGPVHQTAALAREAEAAQPHDVDVAGAVRLALFEDLAGLVDRGEEQPAQNLLVAEAALQHRIWAAFPRMMRVTSGSGRGVRSPPFS
jgi:hypothetical protein